MQQRILVARGEVAGPLVQRFESADNLARLVPHGHSSVAGPRLPSGWLRRLPISEMLALSHSSRMVVSRAMSSSNGPSSRSEFIFPQIARIAAELLLQARLGL